MLHPRRVARLGAVLPLLVALALAACDRNPTDSPATRVRERWHESQAGWAWARPAVAGGVAYFGTGDGKVIARDAGTGARRWAATVGRPDESVAGNNIVVRGGVVAVAVWHRTVALDAATGRELWSYIAPLDTGFGSRRESGQVAKSHLDADDETLYIPAWGASVGAVDLRTGVRRWVWQAGRTPTDTAASGALYRSGAEGVRADGDLVLVTAWHWIIPYGGAGEGWLIALDRATGRERWRVTLPSWRGNGRVTGPPSVYQNLVIASTYYGATYAYDRATARLVWQLEAPERKLTPGAAPEVYGDGVYVDGGDSHLYALDARTGAVRWRSPFATQASADLLVTDRRVVLPEDARLNVFDRRTGRLVADLTQPRVSEYDRLFSSPAAFADGRLFVTLNGAAWSFDEP